MITLSDRNTGDDTQPREAERAIRESEERFRLIANTAPVMIWMSDVDKQVTYVNQPWLNSPDWPLTVRCLAVQPRLQVHDPWRPTAWTACQP
jgi:PAS domain-containing protein